MRRFLAFLHLSRPHFLLFSTLPYLLGVLAAWRGYGSGRAGGIGFMPYVTIYSALPALLLFAVRAPRWALPIILSVWVVYAGFVIPFLVNSG